MRTPRSSARASTASSWVTSPASWASSPTDAVWHVPGANAMAGNYRGRDEIIAFLRRTAELTGGTYRVALLWVVADDEHTVAVYRAQGERDGGRALDIEQALLIELRDGRWADIRAQPLDQAAFDAFWA